MGDYKVLWIDDKHDTEAKSFKYLALNHGIELKAFKSLNKGIEELERNYHFFDAVILDGNFLENENDPVGSEDLKNVREAIKRIDRLPKKFRPFILSGILNQDDDMSKLIADRVYDRREEFDQLELLQDLKKHVENQTYFQVQKKYADIFSVSSDNYLGKEVIPDLFDVLNLIESEFNSITACSYLNRIRKIIEKIFKSFGEKNLIPIELHIGTLSINPIKDYLKNNLNNLEFSGHSHVIKDILEKVVKYSQQGSHSESMIEKHLKVQGKYLFKSLVFDLCELIIWYKSVVDNNIGNFKNEDLEIQGEIIKRENQDFGFVKYPPSNAYIDPILLSKYQLQNGDSIKCLITQSDKGFNVLKIFDVNYIGNAND